MIQDVFLPRKIGTYYLFRSRIVGVEINATDVTATQVSAQGRSQTITKIITVPLLLDSQIEYQVRASEALKAALNQLDPYDELVSVIPSSYVVFKRLTVPFIDHEKIAQVIAFEVEPLLPFPVTSAVFDFIITSIAADKKSAEIMVAAAQKERLQKHLAIFEAAGVKPTAITIDLLSLYALIKKIPAYMAADGIVVVIHINTQATGIAFIQNGNLIMVRTIAKGSAQIAKTISSARGISIDAALEELIRFGIEKTDDTARYEAHRAALNTYLQEILFTCSSSTPENTRIAKAFILGPSAQIPGLLPYASEILQIPCQLFDVAQILDDPHIKLKKNCTLTPQSILSLSAAIPTATMADFNLYPVEEASINRGLFIRQLVSLCLLMLLLFSILGLRFYFQRRSLVNEAVASERETVAALKSRFPDIESTQLVRVIEDASEELKREETTWFAFSSRSRASMLKILLELKTKIDKDALGFLVTKLTITEDSLIIKATVKDHNALKLLEQALRTSTLFKSIEPQTDIDFEMKIVLASPIIKEE